MPEVSRFLGINITFNYDEHIKKIQPLC